jgi:hypothetical protein
VTKGSGVLELLHFRGIRRLFSRTARIHERVPAVQSGKYHRGSRDPGFVLAVAKFKGSVKILLKIEDVLALKELRGVDMLV